MRSMTSTSRLAAAAIAAAVLLGVAAWRSGIVAAPHEVGYFAPVGPGDHVEPRERVSDAEFAVGLFPDIDAAIRNPDTEVDKPIGDYIIDRDDTTSRQINEHLHAGHALFFVRARGACWRLTIHGR
jgi:hypothetical protein